MEVTDSHVCTKIAVEVSPVRSTCLGMRYHMRTHVMCAAFVVVNLLAGQAFLAISKLSHY